MLAIFAFDRPGGDTLIAIDGNAGLTDLYMRGTLGGGVEFATNSEFSVDFTNDPLDWTNFPDLNDNVYQRANGRPLYITNATPNLLTIPLTEATGFTNGSTSARTQFSLANGNLDYRVAGAFTGRLTDPQTGNSWTFTNTANGTLTFTPVGVLFAGPTPTSGRVIPGSTDLAVRGQGQRGSVVIDWSAAVSTFEATCPRIDTVSYTYNGQTLIGIDGVTTVYRPGTGNGTEIDVRVTTGSTVGFALPAPTPKNGFGGITVLADGGINRVPGTSVLSGTITVYDVLRTGEADGSPTQTLTFGFTNASGPLVFTANQPNEWLDIAPGSTLGNLQFVTRFPGEGGLPAGQPALPGRVTISGSERWFEYTVEAAPTTTTVWAGFDVQSAVTVDATRYGGGFNVLSPIVNAPSLTVRGPSTVNVAAPTSVTGGITLGKGQVDGTILPEIVTAVVDAPIAASTYTLRVAFDSLTVSPSGSLSGALPDASGGLSQAAGAVSVQLLGADLFVHGTIFATNQFYEQVASYTRPLSLTTVSADTGLDSGLIRGGTVVVNMAAQGSGTAPPDPTNADTSFHVVDLRTQVDTFRTRAAGTGNVYPGQNMYPYLLSIREADAITFDAVAGSSRPISLSAEGSITMGSGLDTLSDLTIAAVSTSGAATSFTVSAPIQTRFGAIDISADTIDVRNSVRVTNAAVDATRNDITLTASNGDILAQNLVAAVNNVNLVQRKTGTGSRVVADGLRARSATVDADGDVTLGTTLETLSGRSGGGFSIRETDDISIPSLLAGGRVALTARGVDGGTTTANPIALSARIDDVTALEVTTPNGSADVVVNTPNLLTLGGAKAPAVANMLAAGNVTIRSTAGDMRLLDAPLAGGNARVVKAASTAILTATYARGTPNVTAATLTGTGSINVLAAFDGQTLAVGDRVLVRLGSRATAGAPTTTNSNGVYIVARVGGGVGVNANWQLTRAADSDTSPELSSGSYVRVATGTALADTLWQASYLAFPATSADLSSATEIEIPTTYAAMGQLAVGQTVTGAGVAGTITAIDPITGVITLSANAVTNVGGSAVVRFRAPALGFSPITMTQQRATMNVGSDAVAKTVEFIVSTTGRTNSSAGSLGKMLLVRQQNDVSASVNPDQITKFTVGGLSGPIRLTQELPLIQNPLAITAGNVFVDGSGIVTSRNGLPTTAASVVNGFEFVAGSGTTVDANGDPQAGASLSGFTIGGFGRGAAVRIDSVAGVLVDRVTLGRNTAGQRLANQYGVLATGLGTTSAAILNSSVFSSTVAGVSVESGAAGVKLVGSTVGGTNLNNAVGVRLSSVGSNQIGVEPSLPSRDLAAVSVARGLAGHTITVPANYVGLSDLVVGLGVRGTGIAEGAQVLTIAAGANDTRVLTLTLDGVTTGGVTSSGTGAVTFGNFVATTVGGATLTLPAGVAMGSLFLGQSVTGTGIPSAAKIAAIDVATRRITLTLPMTVTGTTAVVFGVGGRNTITGNLEGMRLTAGTNTVINTDIHTNAYDGIVITGGTQRVGTSRNRAATSNAIYGNGGFGISQTAGIAAAQQIWGNYIGMQVNGSASRPNVRGPVTPPRPINATTQLDADGNQYAPVATSTSGGGGSGSSGTTRPRSPVFPLR